MYIIYLWYAFFIFLLGGMWYLWYAFFIFLLGGIFSMYASHGMYVFFLLFYFVMVCTSFYCFILFAQNAW